MSKRYPPTPRKYASGAPVGTLVEAVEAVVAERYLMVNGRPMHPAAVRCWTLGTLAAAISGGRLCHAVLSPPPAVPSPAPVDQDDADFREVST